ncbi:hypothetical protein BDV32DRAFT_147477 [Aspergillus pseudonomiae]|uniref:Uncharacterized protein n=1 Tax=Aspergillus pseudonomiae TaxID=1506151 RepID=A0A5N7D441_9EURO|nr:uncharacterized protein BDV37DRAFT_285881 [Aspergillus pseudonomiae]KAB8262556.1 hypothetical protein BDV32DRAFT_147477 [Aspergillus pseudonomiae]KAE8401182.1 hypothetical protein BDV37DRAFT_285881 [Aspergillus pseudonomiae]
MGTWTASIPSCSDLTSKHYVPSSPLSHLEPARGHKDTHYDTANRPQSPVWNRNKCPINSDLSIGLDVDPTECNLSDEAALEASRPETGSAPSAKKASLKALLEKIRRENGTDQVDLLTLCFGEPGVDLHVHIQGDFTVALP